MIGYEEVKKNISAKVVERMDFTKDLSEEEIFTTIDDVIMTDSIKSNLSLLETMRLRKDVFNSLKKLDILQDFLENDEITEIMINGTDRIFVERNGCIEEVSKEFESKEKLENVIQQIVAGCNRTVNEASPIADARLGSGERVNIVLPPVALNGPIVTIRRFPTNPITMEKLIEIGSISKEAADFLKMCVQAKYNIFISGGTGSGKTTFLNALSQYIPVDERIITIEDSAELQLLNARNLVRLETRNKTGEGCSPIEIKDLIKTALRMRPERIIVGEVRGAEALDMLQSMNTGHDGSLSTGHGNSPKDMIARLETMVLWGVDIPLYAIRGQIAGGIDLFVHLGRLKDRSRKVLEITEVEGLYDGEIKLNTLYKWNGSFLEKTGHLTHKDKIYSSFSEEKCAEIINGL